MNIVVCGYGRAGSALMRQIISSKKDNLVGVLCRDESDAAGCDIGKFIKDDYAEFGLSITRISEAKDVLHEQKVDVIIDFSNRTMAIPLLSLCSELHCNLVVCTTNHTPEEIGCFGQIAEQQGIGVVYAPNLTIGINLLLDFAKKLSNVLDGFQYEIIERHPTNKPIPTATSRIIAETVNKENIPIHSMRMEGFVGVHELVATDGVERITIRHESLSRAAFAKGALIAADFIRKKTGLFFMKDVICELDYDKGA